MFCFRTRALLQGEDVFMILMAMRSFVHSFHEEKFCGVLLCDSDKLGCAKGEEVA